MKSNLLYSMLCILSFSINVSAASSCGDFLRPSVPVNDLVRSSVRSLEDTKKMMARANDEYRSHDYVNSIASLNAILAYKPDDVIALNQLVLSQTNLGLISEARLNKEKIISIEDRYSEVSYVTYAQLLILDGDPEKSIKYLNEVLDSNPKNPAALGLISSAYMSMGQLTLAKTYIDEKGLLDVNDPKYQILLYEYNYKQGKDRADFYKRALGVANNMQHAYKPKKDEVRVSRAYRKSLALRAKALAALNDSPSDLKKALKDIQEYESYNRFTSSWSLLLQAEILYKLGRMAESQSLLLKLLSDTNARDLLVIAALVHIETQGKNIKIDNELINSNLDQLTPLETLEVLKLSNNLDWNYNPPKIENAWYNVRISNQFWYTNDSVLLPASNSVARASSVPRRVVRRRGFH